MMAFSCFCFAGCDDGAATADPPAATEEGGDEGSGEKAEMEEKEMDGEEKKEMGSDEKAAGSDAK